MASMIYVDNSNYYLCGLDQAKESGNPDLVGSDYGALYDMLTFGEAPRCARIYSARRPGGNEFDHERARQAGFEVVLAERVMGREKGVDASLAIALLGDSYELHQPGDVVILVAGDLDYVPAVQNLRKRGIEVYVAFWSSGLATKLAKAATKVVCLDGHLRTLMRRGRRKVAPAGAAEHRQQSAIA